MLDGLEFHHVGLACTDLDAEAARLAPLGYRPESPDFEDPLQGVRGRFLIGVSPRLELLVALEGSKVLTAWLSAGVKMYHLAYLTSDLAAAIDGLCEDGGRLVVEPVPAVAFDGRYIAFVMLATGLLIELIEKE